MSKTRFSGSYVATITPFKSHVDEVDYEAFERLIDWQIGQGTNGLVPCGTTGESPTITDTEQLKLIELTVKISAGRAVVMAGTGANSTKEAIHLTTQAQKLGANASLQVVPYYNKPTQEGLYQHFKAIHDATDIPLILYNIPGRSVVQLSDETFQRLYELPRICGVKDATADLTKPLRRDWILFGSLFAQDFPLPGLTSLASVTVNLNREKKREVDHNGFPIRPALLGDWLVIRGRLAEISRARFWCAFEMARAADGQVLVTARQALALVKMPEGKPQRLPAAWALQWNL